MTRYHALVVDVGSETAQAFWYDAPDDEVAYGIAVKWFGLATRTVIVRRQEGPMYELVRIWNP